jgi:hypothetical protein
VPGDDFDACSAWFDVDESDTLSAIGTDDFDKCVLAVSTTAMQLNVRQAKLEDNGAVAVE